MASSDRNFAQLAETLRDEHPLDPRDELRVS
jgi:hypothetical protein